MARKNQFKVLTLFVFLLFAVAAPLHALQLASRSAEEWIKTLESPQRVQAQKVDEVIGRLGLKPGQVVADIGAGSGVFSRPLAKAVSPSGKVFAVDIDKKLLDYIDHSAKEQNLNNIQTVLGQFDDPKIPSRTVDVAFINDVLHHIEHRAAYLKALGSYVKPGGRLALIEMNRDDPNTAHKNQPELLVSRQDIDKWLSDAGFKLAKEHPDLFPGTKFFLIYEKK